VTETPPPEPTFPLFGLTEHYKKKNGTLQKEEFLLIYDFNKGFVLNQLFGTRIYIRFDFIDIKIEIIGSALFIEFLGPLPGISPSLPESYIKAAGRLDRFDLFSR